MLRRPTQPWVRRGCPDRTRSAHQTRPLAKTGTRSNPAPTSRVSNRVTFGAAWRPGSRPCHWRHRVRPFDHANGVIVLVDTGSRHRTVVVDPELTRLPIFNAAAVPES